MRRGHMHSPETYGCHLSFQHCMFWFLLRDSLGTMVVDPVIHWFSARSVRWTLWGCWLNYRLVGPIWVPDLVCWG